MEELILDFGVYPANYVSWILLTSRSPSIIQWIEYGDNCFWPVVTYLIGHHNFPSSLRHVPKLRSRILPNTSTCWMGISNFKLCLWLSNHKFVSLKMISVWIYFTENTEQNDLKRKRMGIKKKKKNPNCYGALRQTYTIIKMKFCTLSDKHLVCFLAVGYYKCMMMCMIL